MRKLPSALAICLVALLLAGCGGGVVSRSAAVDNIVSAIDGGPSWATGAEHAVAEGFLAFQDTENGRSIGKCAWINGHNSRGGFVCFLETSLLPGATHYYFRENGNGSDVRPISRQVFLNLVLGSMRGQVANTAPPNQVMLPLPAGLTAAQRAVFTAGEYVVGESGCLACHTIGDNGNNGPGPPLTKIGSRLTADAIAAVLRNPVAPMPSFASIATQSPKKFKDLVTFLTELR